VSTVRQFTTGSARSIPLVVGISMVILVETLALHVFLNRWQPVAARAMTLVSLASVLWLVQDDRALARLPVEVDDETVNLRCGRRFAVKVPRADIAEVRQLTWRDVPSRGPGYLKGSGFAQPNVAVRFTEPLAVKIFGVTKQVSTVGLRLDDPAGFVAALQEPERAASATTAP